MGLEYEAVRAPELRGSAWINTERPLTLGDLRGKLTLLDFWTYCCINCLHVLDDLKYLENKYSGQPFAVVGVHSPKFTTEDDAQSVRQAVARNGITHPVLLDSGRKTWDAYAVRGWPTLVLVDPRGYVLGRVSGEGHRDELDAAIGEALEHLGAADLLDDRPLPVRLEAEAGALDPTSPLLYPGKVLADEASGALFVADTGHHRVIQARLDGSDAREIGAGAPGTEDGDAETARFRSPQGMALDGERGWLYIADSGNHLVRRLDLVTGAVLTVAGTGAQGSSGRDGGPRARCRSTRRGTSACCAASCTSRWPASTSSGCTTPATRPSARSRGAGPRGERTARRMWPPSRSRAASPRMGSRSTSPTARSVACASSRWAKTGYPRAYARWRAATSSSSATTTAKETSRASSIRSAWPGRLRAVKAADISMSPTPTTTSCAGWTSPHGT
ncbi:MAG: thioredoxin-like domain-containing protein [Ktedonobacterales bacterium]